MAVSKKSKKKKISTRKSPVKKKVIIKIVKKSVSKRKSKSGKSTISTKKRVKTKSKTKTKTRKLIKKPRKLKKSKKVKRTRRPKKLLEKKLRSLDLRRSEKNPIMSPINESYWESEGAFNPGAVIHGGKVHLFYRALGPDGISRVGYASSKDGIHFDRKHPYPVYMPELNIPSAFSTTHAPYTSPARLAYDRVLYASGGGWGGCEDPRAVKIDGRIYLTFNIFNGWDSIRVGLTSISEDDLEKGNWNWRQVVYLSPLKERHKNWVLFPEKVGDKYALLHNLYDPDPNRVQVEYLNNLNESPRFFKSEDPHFIPNREISWHYRTRSAGPPPVKTKYGWLLFYHAMDKDDPDRYKLGVVLLDSKDPTRILYRSKYPILEPDEWYENDWKPGIIYASGAVVKGDTLFVYYGGGDKHIGVAYTNLKSFVEKLMKNQHVTLTKKSVAVA